ncbi:hypothetical protein [Spartinivicinus poritis]|uniref:Uncharacterized protein n=1 Tax=Spartinivicinus poritis TaxID=2994640 RepID=A0ABT5UHU3_9GAMM|nr:hypothetical protein [Spartinivicinus sp. A2-2]MDE1465571.1 hypothetical protein [Spartinivicinus sp. A2-2]
MKKLFLLILALSLFGCNPIESFEEMTAKQDEFNELSLKELGVEAFVGWNIHNGRLNTVTIIYPQWSLKQLTVGELERKTLKIVDEVFKEKPNTVTYGFRSVHKS